MDLGTIEPPAQLVLGLSQGQNSQGMAVTTHPYLALRLKNGQNYTSTPALCHHSMLQDDPHLSLLQRDNTYLTSS